MEASLADALGPESTVSKSTVSRICEAIKDEFDTWKTRDLSGIEVDYFFADGSYFRMHPGAPAEPVLVAWGITSAGKPVFLGMEPGSSESHDAWAGFFRGLSARGLRDPLLNHLRRRQGPDRGGGDRRPRGSRRRRGRAGATSAAQAAARNRARAFASTTSWPRCRSPPRARSRRPGLGVEVVEDLPVLREPGE